MRLVAHNAFDNKNIEARAMIHDDYGRVSSIGKIFFPPTGGFNPLDFKFHKREKHERFAPQCREKEVNSVAVAAWCRQKGEWDAD